MLSKLISFVKNHQADIVLVIGVILISLLSFGNILNTGGKTMTTLLQKEQAHKLIDRVPANATWDDLMHEIYVREVIERGLADSLAGKTKDVKEVRVKYGLPE